MPRITDLPLITEPADDDRIYVVDRGDLSEGSDGASKQIKKSDLVGARKVQIGSTITSLSSGAGIVFEWSSIPQNFKRLILEGNLKSAINSVADAVYCNFNTDTSISSTNYQSVYVSGLNSSATAMTPSGGSIAAPWCGGVPGNSSLTPADSYNSTRIVIEGYNNAFYKMALTHTVLYREPTTWHRVQILQGTCLWRNTQAINNIRLTALNTPNQLWGSMTLYGEE